MAFPYDEANNVHGLMERKRKNSKQKDKSNFWEKHNEYNRKSTMKWAKFLCFYCYDNDDRFFFNLNFWIRIGVEFCWFQRTVCNWRQQNAFGFQTWTTLVNQSYWRKQNEAKFCGQSWLKETKANCNYRNMVTMYYFNEKENCYV